MKIQAKTYLLDNKILYKPHGERNNIVFLGSSILNYPYSLSKVPSSRIEPGFTIGLPSCPILVSAIT
jgi:hypothetical protein